MVNLSWPAVASYLDLVTSISLLYLFPDGRFVPRWFGKRRR